MVTDPAWDPSGDPDLTKASMARTGHAERSIKPGELSFLDRLGIRGAKATGGPERACSFGRLNPSTDTVAPLCPLRGHLPPA